MIRQRSCYEVTAVNVMLRGDGSERHAKRHLAPKCGPVRKSVEFGSVELDGLVGRYIVEVR